MLSKKKILLSSVFGFAVIVAVTNIIADDFAPNPELFSVTPTKATAKMTHGRSGIYVEGNAGYARQNYASNINWISSSSPAAPSFSVGTNYNNNGNVNGGFSGGADAGYQFDQNFAVELGWFYLPSVNVMQAGTPPAYLTSWAMYLAAKYLMPLPWMHNTDAFFKLGAEYRSATLPDAAVAGAYGYSIENNNQTSFVRPMFATGLSYYFNHELMGIAQYAYFMGANDSFTILGTPSQGSLGIVAANVFTLGLGYQFDV